MLFAAIQIKMSVSQNAPDSLRIIVFDVPCLVDRKLLLF